MKSPISADEKWSVTYHRLEFKDAPTMEGWSICAGENYSARVLLTLTSEDLARQIVADHNVTAACSAQFASIREAVAEVRTAMNAHYGGHVIAQRMDRLESLLAALDGARHGDAGAMT